MIKAFQELEMSISCLSAYKIEPNIIKCMLKNLNTLDCSIGVLKRAKKNTGLKSKELAKFLGVAEPTLYYWEKKDIWPSWALRKCGILACA